MRILQIYKDYYPPVIGGIEGHINILAKGLSRRGINVEVLISNNRLETESQLVDGIRVTKAGELGRLFSAPINVNFPRVMKRLAARSDLLHFHLPNPTAVLSFLACGINKPVVATYHSDIVRQVHLEKLYRPFDRAFLKKVRSIIATSPNYIHTSTVLKRMKAKCVVIPLGVKVDRFDHLDKEKVSAIRRRYKTPIILFIGKFRYYKGLHVLIQAMRNIDATLVMIGEGDKTADLKKRARTIAVSDKIHFVGELSEEDVNVYLKACDIFVLPSILRSEAFGVVLVEAMACGKPVISTELGTGTTFVNVHKNTGFVVEPNRPDRLAQAVNFLLSHPEYIEYCGKNARDRAHTLFSADRMVQDTIRLYQETIS